MKRKRKSMEIIHVSAECYPVAKTGGLGDVVGALPKYQAASGHITKVVMPMFRTKFLYENAWELVHQGGQRLGGHWFHYNIIKEKNNKLGFDLYLVDIQGLLDREKVYGYEDDADRFIGFQIAVCDWLNQWQHKPDVLHCHDHHTGLIPFMIKYCYEFSSLAHVPSVFTIHNAEYQGWMGWDKSLYIPPWDMWNWGKLDWNNTINPLASGIKCADIVTTVSPNYLTELRTMSNGLEPLFEYEKGKCVGILNGIDSYVWDPQTDKYLTDHYGVDDEEAGKAKNKMELCERFNLDFQKPLISFIGRLVGEKGADLLPGAIADSFRFIGRRMNFLVLGSGHYNTERELEGLLHQASGDYNVYVGYNEALSHTIYAGSDFLLMPSRVEPCGLNQMYAMRYGTVPMVRRTGGLQDTVIDYEDPNGYGICYVNASVGDICNGVWRATELYRDKKRMKTIRERMMQLDFDWKTSTQKYIDVYSRLV